MCLQETIKNFFILSYLRHRPVAANYFSLSAYMSAWTPPKQCSLFPRRKPTKAQSNVGLHLPSDDPISNKKSQPFADKCPFPELGSASPKLKFAAGTQRPAAWKIDSPLDRTNHAGDGHQTRNYRSQ